MLHYEEIFPALSFEHPSLTHELGRRYLDGPISPHPPIRKVRKYDLVFRAFNFRLVGIGLIPIRHDIDN